MIKYSVIISAYNAQEFIGECLESILNQGRNDVEVLVVSDGCQESLNVALNYPVKVFYSKTNCGVFVMFNSLVKYATGNRLCFFGADDLMTDNFFEEMDKNQEPIIRYHYSNFNHPNKHLAIKHEHISEGIFCIDKDLFILMNGFCCEFRCGMDTEFRLRCEANKIQTFDNENVLCLRRLHANSLTQKKETRHGSEYRQWVYKFLDKKTAYNDWANPPVMEAVEVSLVKD